MLQWSVGLLVKYKSVYTQGSTTQNAWTYDHAPSRIRIDGKDHCSLLEDIHSGMQFLMKLKDTVSYDMFSRNVNTAPWQYPLFKRQ